MIIRVCSWLLKSECHYPFSFSLSQDDISFLPPQCLCQREVLALVLLVQKLFKFSTFTDTLALHLFREIVSSRPQVTLKSAKLSLQLGC